MDSRETLKTREPAPSRAAQEALLLAPSFSLGENMDLEEIETIYKDLMRLHKLAKKILPKIEKLHEETEASCRLQTDKGLEGLLAKFKTSGNSFALSMFKIDLETFIRQIDNLTERLPHP